MAVPLHGGRHCLGVFVCWNFMIIMVVEFCLSIVSCFFHMCVLSFKKRHHRAALSSALKNLNSNEQPPCNPQLIWLVWMLLVSNMIVIYLNFQPHGC